MHFALIAASDLQPVLVRELYSFDLGASGEEGCSASLLREHYRGVEAMASKRDKTKIVCQGAKLFLT